MSDLGVYFLRQYERDSLLSFEKFSEKFIDRQIPEIALSLADEELLDYYDFLTTKILLPRMDSILPYEHRKLEKWFIANFANEILNGNNRLSTQDTALIKSIEEDLIKVRKKIIKLYSSSNLSPNKYNLFLRKLLHKIWLEDEHKNVVYYPSYVDQINNDLESGSTLFLLELYQRLLNENLVYVLSRFQDYIINFDKNEVNEFLSKPMLMVKLWTHQEEALDAWFQNDKQGIIEMATATGKTVVGLSAIIKLYNDSLKLNQKDPNYKKLNVLVLTHSKAILNQWRREVIEKLGLSGNPTDSYTKPIDYNGLRISFNTLQTVYRIPTAYRADFLIVDEVHHSAAYEYRKALEVSCKYKMGLSATIEGKQKISYLKNYLGDKIYTLSIKEARERNIIPEFKWDIFVTNLNVVETQEFDKVTDDINKIFDKISKESDFYTERIFGKRMRILTLKDFIELIERARYEGKDKILPDSWKYLSIIIQQRRRIIHKSAPKIKKAIEIAEKEAVNKKCILFTMDIETCDKIAKELKDKGIKTYVVHSNFNDNDNKNTLSNFKLAKNGILISAKMLDEGVDIPDATVGINVSSSRTKLQLVQRIGRILRNYPGKKPIFYHLIAVPHKEQFLEREDSLDYIDDVSWVQGMALQWNVEAQVKEDSQEIVELKQRSENFIKELIVSNDNINQNYGTIKVKSILSRMDEQVRFKLARKLSIENGRITDNRWRTLLIESYKEVNDLSGELLNSNGYWWVLIAGGREPRTIQKMVEKSLIS